MSDRIAVFPGSFDPITTGHEEIIKRAIPMFDKIIVAIGINTSKKYLNSLDTRMEAIKSSFQSEDKVEVDSYQGLTIDYCKSKAARYLLRGLRNAGDFEFERNIAQLNKELNPEIESIFLISDGRYSAISSSIVREIQIHGGEFKQFIPENARHLF